MTDNGPDSTSPFRQKLNRAASAVRDAASAAVRKVKEAAQLDFYARFKGEETVAPIDFSVDMGHDTVWATQAQMADLFGVNVPAVSKHISNIYEEGDLSREATISNLETVRFEGGREVRREIEHYNLDMILAVGYRVSGKKATEFRKWASGVLKGYIQEGYALNGARLNNDPAALLRLSQDVRSLRTSEQNIYAQVREAFKISAIDYDGNSDEARRFYARTQDAFHWAISEHTSAQLILERADGRKPNMGMTSLGNVAPTLAHAKVAKNYLTGQELRSLEIIGDQWLLYAEGMAQRGKTMTMSRLANKLDEIIAMNEYAVFPGYQKVGAKRDVADEHAKRQLDIYRNASKLK